MPAIVLGVMLWVAGTAFGAVSAIAFLRRNSIGSLRIDRSEPEEPPKIFLEINKGASFQLLRREYVTLKVIAENYISQK